MYSCKIPSTNCKRSDTFKIDLIQFLNVRTDDANSLLCEDPQKVLTVQVSFRNLNNVCVHGKFIVGVTPWNVAAENRKICQLNSQIPFPELFKTLETLSE